MPMPMPMPTRLFLLLLLLPMPTFSQTLTIGELQVVKVDALTRPVAQIDPVERAIAAGNWLPQADTLLEAAADGWFLEDALTGNYLVANVRVEQAGVWLLEAMAYANVYVNGELRIGNVYGYKDDWEPWEPHFNFSLVPVHLQAGDNQLVFFGVRWGRMRASLRRATAELSLNARDVTFPDLVVGQATESFAAIPVLNATSAVVTDAQLQIRNPDGVTVRVDVPPLPPFGVRKVGLPIRAAARQEPGTARFEVLLYRGDAALDTTQLQLAVKNPGDNRRVTFRSVIDNSVQYFGYLAASDNEGRKALVLSLHGAGVEAINQSGSYAPLSWAHIVAPTNRRPFGFDWENWGRLDALEVLDGNLSALAIDADRIYLTGHSMGGHGSWHLATLHPDRFAAVGPSAGWITYWSYRRKPPSDAATPLKDMLARATLTSQTLSKARNLAGLGVYVLHGATDDNVPPAQSYLMLEQLKEFHHDYVYHEEPDVGHWWDLSDEPGADCLTWAPMFDFFARHRRPAADEVRDIHFLTPSPGVSAWNHWVGIARQQRVFEMSRVDMHLDPWGHRVSGTTHNVELLGLNLERFATDSIQVELDGHAVAVLVPDNGKVWLEHDDSWKVIAAPDPAKKSPQRSGGFRDAFGNRVQLVVGTQGSAAETAWAWAKARYDAEYLWYQGNASIDVIADTAFDPDAEPHRNVILYGNADTHAHWDALVSGALRLENGRFSIGGQQVRADDLGLLAIRPRPGSDSASVGIIGGTGLRGCRLTERRPYLQGGFAYPDLTLLEDRDDGTVVRGAGFFGNDWSVASGEFIWAEGF